MESPDSDRRGPDAAPYRLTGADTCRAFGTDPERGLPAAEAARRLAHHGRNELAGAPPVPAWRRLLGQFESPLVLLLVAAGIVSLVVWWLEHGGGVPYEALTIFVIVIANAALGFVQEARAEAAVASLRSMTAAMAAVIREGQRQAVPAAEVVPGDLVVIEEGVTIPADARLLESASLQTAEAALTGESAPVMKDPAPLQGEVGIGDRTNMLFAGTAATYGHGLAVVTATGMQTEIGRIAGLLETTRAEATPLQRQLDRTGKVLGAIVIAIALIVAATILAVTRDLSAAVLTGVLLYTVSLAVSAVPEGLSAVTTVVLSLGMQRMAKRNVIVRKLAAVETLGSATIICTDKTGTLTRNEMTVRALVTASARIDFSGTGYAPEGELRVGDAPLAAHADAQREAAWALSAAFLSNNAQAVCDDGRWRVFGDPTEGALKVAALKARLDPARLDRRFARVAELPFSSERKLMSTAHTDAREAGRVVLVSKGAPDVLLARCAARRVGGTVLPLDEAGRAAIRAAIDALAADALRTLGLACREVDAATAAALDESHESDLVWLGVAGIMDPPRAEAAEAVRRAHDAGVRVTMITGDHPLAASAIATELGIARPGERAVTGAMLAAMDPGELARVAQTANVYARVSSEHKLAIVRALQAHGHVVAMTGDGVNDAPALKAADIGVAMGITGTDVSKEAASMILTDDNFASIVAAVEEGRSIYANIQKFLRYLLSTNLGEVLVMFFGVVLAGLLGVVAGEGEVLVLPLTATMILWINLVTDSFPALAVGVDPADAALMHRAPRDPKSGVITRRMWIGIGVASVVMCIGTLLVLDAALPGGLIEGDRDVAAARTLAFHTLVLYQLFDVFCIRSDEASAARGLFSNRWLWLSVLFALALQGLVLYVPALQKAFSTVPLGAADWVLCLAVASTVLYAREALKAWWRRADRASTAAHVD